MVAGRVRTMSEQSKTCANPKRFLWLRRRLKQIDWAIDRAVWSRVADLTHKYTEAPHFNRFLAGVGEFAWTKVCGYGWRFAAHCGGIYWGLVKVKYDAGPLPDGGDLGTPGENIPIE